MYNTLNLKSIFKVYFIYIYLKDNKKIYNVSKLFCVLRAKDHTFQIIKEIQKET